jgi:outer membrane protein assembly factor BamB
MRRPLTGRLTATLVFLPALAGGADWPQWRGPEQNGVSAETSNWPAGWPPKRLWSADVGAGCTSPILAQGRLFVTGWAGQKPTGQGTDTVCCFDSRTGREIWKQAYPARYQGRVRIGDTGGYGGPSATPSFDPATGRLYTLGVDGDLRAWDGRGDGRLLWSTNLYEQFKVARRPNVGGGQRDFGFTAAPLVHGDLLIVEVGSAGGTVVAFDQANGQVRWKSEYARPAGHTGGIVPTKTDSGDALLLLTLSDLVLLRADNGRTIASYPWQTDFGCNIPTPAVQGSRVLVTSGYNQSRSALVDFPAGRPREVWQSKAFATVASPVIVGDRAFLIDDRLRCLDLTDGRVEWQGGSFGHGSCIATADGKLLVFGNGRLALVDAGAAEYRELAVVRGLVPGTCYPHVAFAEGVIAVKDRDGRLVCLSVRPEGRS